VDFDRRRSPRVARWNSRAVFLAVPTWTRRGRAILLMRSNQNIPTSFTVNDRLAERVAVLAAEAGQPVDAFVERLVEGRGLIVVSGGTPQH
jgi:hypothetical protein